jgi:hypothetical protein
MNLYSFTLALGSAGLAVMALSGLGHSVTHGHGHGHAHGQGNGQGHGHGHGHAHGHGHTAGAHGHAHLQDAAQRAAWTLLSPRLLFSLLVGFGAAGLIARDVAAPWRALLAVGGALLFERALVRPIWNLAMRFASTPALTLESCIDDEARAVTNFDEQGQGLIAVELDGRVIQLLGTLRRDDQTTGMRVRAGDPVWIEDVDGTRNRCTVRRTYA